MSKITINVVEPGGSTPVAPNTGLFMNDIGTPEAIAIISAVIILGIIAAFAYKKFKKSDKTSKLAHIIEQIKSTRSNKKHVATGIAVISLLILGCTFTAFLLNASAMDGENNLTVNTSDQEFTVEVADEPVFAVFPVEVSIEEATENGYILTAYANNADLVSTTNPNDIIPMITLEGNDLAALSDNTWGLALEGEPSSKDEATYTTLSTSENNPTILNNTDDYSATEANDTTTIYYGFYITPDMPYGTYTGGEVVYEAIPNRSDLATVTFDGNGLYFNDDPNQTQNTVKFLPNTETSRTVAYTHTPNVDNDGIQDGYYTNNLNATNVYRFADEATKVHVKAIRSGSDKWCAPPDSGDYFSFWSGSHPEYTALNDYSTAIQAFGSTDGKNVFKNYSTDINEEVDLPDQNSVTFAYTTNDSDTYAWCKQNMSGYGYYAIITAYDSNNNEVALIGNEPYMGDYLVPDSTKKNKLLGWSTDKDATTPSYRNEQDIALELSLEPNKKMTLYAVWQRGIGITYNGNNADSKTNMDGAEQEAYAMDLASANLQVDLLASNFQRKGYGFVGWSADPDAWNKLTDDDDSNNPTIYGPNQTITIDGDLVAIAGENGNLVLNAIWAPAEKDSQGNPVYLQSWTGCSSLDRTVYDSTTDTLIAGKNTVTALTDSRDNGVYTIARLADGNCWMTENLRLDNSMSNETTTSEFTAENTNNPSVPFTNDYASNTRSNRLSTSSEDWCDVSSVSCADQSRFNNSNTINTASTVTFNHNFTWGESVNVLDDSIYLYGNYYNLYSATAGNSKYYDTEGRIITGDICPTGWHIPIHLGDTSGSFYYLDSQMGGGDNFDSSNRWRSFPSNFVYSGKKGGNGYQYRGLIGHYWTTTPNNGNYAYTFNVHQGYLLLDEGVNVVKHDGASVRCMAEV